MTRLRHSSPFRAQRGVSVLSAVFLLLLFGVLAALMANVISTAHTTSAEDILGSKAYQAARGGIEWGLYQVLDPSNGTATLAAPNAGNATTNQANNALPDCFTPDATVDGLGATVSVHCDIYPSSGDYFEGTKRIRIYRLTATATLPGPSGLTIERRVEVTAEKCRDTGSTTSPYDC